MASYPSETKASIASEHDNSIVELPSISHTKSATLSGDVKSVDSTASASHEPTKGFLDLSAELRNKIYAYCLVSPQSTQKTKWHLPGDRRYFAPNVKLLSTCKQVHSEATPLLYGLNAFHFITRYGGISFLKQIGPSIKRLRQFRIVACMINLDLKEVLTLLQAATSLQTLILDSTCAYVHSRSIAAALLPLVQKINISLRVGPDSKAAADVVEFLPRVWNGEMLTDRKIRAAEAYAVEVRRLLQIWLK